MGSRTTEEAREYYLEHYDRIRRQQRDYHYRKTHGITLLEFEEMIHSQNGKCALCGRSPSKQKGRRGWLHLDHDHATGRRRALLCITCNTELGAYERRKVEFENYLTQHED